MHISAIASLLVLAVSQVASHGMMNWPIPRPLPGDQQNGFTYARAASNRNTAVHPDPDINCSYLPQGPVFTQVMAPGPAVIDYTITAWHNGGCIIYLSRDGQKTWEAIGEDKTCGVQSLNPSGRGSINVVLPSGTYNAVLRWYYLADNGGSPNEFFNNCADISVAASGSNKHEKVEFLGSPAAGYIALAKSPSKYFDSSCPQTGATLCSDNKKFINQCVSLAAGGGWSGGSSWFSYQCPDGTTCQADSCVGSNGKPQPTVAPPKTASTIAPSPIKTTTTTTTTTTAAGGSTGGDGTPCAKDNELRLPVPQGLDCHNVKEACQTHCFSNKWYNIEFNRCYDEKDGSAMQWCRCDGVTWYGAVFGKPTKACPTDGGSNPGPAPATTATTTTTTTTTAAPTVPKTTTTSTTTTKIIRPTATTTTTTTTKSIVSTSVPKTTTTKKTKTTTTTKKKTTTTKTKKPKTTTKVVKPTSSPTDSSPLGQACTAFGTSQCISGVTYVCNGMPHVWQVWYTRPSC
ncbi:hypothetical protein BDR26DRAFT_858449 [Obelidium mucronatum]|nr:hypothetical protein BDR26DRAFT_858449 [Obelidium mucronatum]